MNSCNSGLLVTLATNSPTITPHPHWFLNIQSLLHHCLFTSRFSWPTKRDVWTLLHSRTSYVPVPPISFRFTFLTKLAQFGVSRNFLMLFSHPWTGSMSSCFDLNHVPIGDSKRSVFFPRDFFFLLYLPFFLPTLPRFHFSSRVPIESLVNYHKQHIW